MTTPIKVGDLQPDLVINCSDLDGDADFTAVTAGNFAIEGYLKGIKVWDLTPDNISVGIGGETVELRRSWASGETDVPGRYYLVVKYDWGGGRVQSFPADDWMIFDIQNV